MGRPTAEMKIEVDMCTVLRLVLSGEQIRLILLIVCAAGSQFTSARSEVEGVRSKTRLDLAERKPWLHARPAM